MSGVLSWLMPKVRLGDAAFVSRHRVLRTLLWLHVPVVVVIAVLNGHGVTGDHAAHAGGWLVWSTVAGIVLAGVAEQTVGQVTAGAAAAATAVGGVADRLGAVSAAQREVADSLREQTTLAASTRSSVAAAAEKVSASAHP